MRRAELKYKEDEWNEVHNPVHYNKTGIETIDLIRKWMEPDEYKGYLKGNIIKYMSRYKYKKEEEPLTDVLKAQWYLEKLIEELRDEENDNVSC